MRTPDRFREDAGWEPNEAREDARIDAIRDAQPWWPEWANKAGVKRPAPEHDDDRLF